MKKLSGKVALVTGGNSGMGLETAKLFAEQGAKIIIAGRRQEELDRAVKYIGGDVLAIKTDVSKISDINNMYDVIKKTHKKIDIIFANAGLGAFVPFDQVSEEQFDHEFNVNVKGLFFTVQKALPILNDNASIILNASVAASKGIEAFSVYSATKAAVRSLARTLTSDLKSRKIRVNAISPGPIDTPIYDKLGLTKEQTEGFKHNMGSTVPLGRMGTSKEIASTVLFLASDDSSYITGIELTVDGGMAQV